MTSLAKLRNKIICHRHPFRDLPIGCHTHTSSTNAFSSVFPSAAKASSLLKPLSWAQQPLPCGRDKPTSYLTGEIFEALKPFPFWVYVSLINMLIVGLSTENPYFFFS